MLTHTHTYKITAHEDSLGPSIWWFNSYAIGSKTVPFSSKHSYVGDRLKVHVHLELKAHLTLAGISSAVLHDDRFILMNTHIVKNTHKPY